jgi:hypothetical protein
MRTRLILLEGLAGSGKSSTGQKLYHIISGSGASVDFMHEFNLSHPISRENISNISDWHYNVTQNWIELVKTLENNKMTIILDAAFLQYPVGELLEQGEGKNKIFDYVNGVTGILNTINPVLIYLRHHNIDKAIARIYNEREINWQNKVCNFLNYTPYGLQSELSGFDLYLFFNRPLAKICDAIFANCNFNKFKLSLKAACSSKEILEICNFLKLPPIKTKIEATPYQGTYIEARTGRQAVISLKDDMLEISGLFLIAKNLLHKRDDIFFVYGKPYELNFSRDNSGRIDGFSLSGYRDNNKNTRWQLSS